MGDPRRKKTKYETPVHPWQKERLEQEKSLMQVYGLVNKKEVYRADSKLKKFKFIAKKLITKSPQQAEKERKQLFEKLKSLNLVTSESLDDVLGLKIEQIMDRRLQTVVFKKGLSRSIKQARQMITHRHIMVSGKKVTSPSYLVKASQEENLEFYPNSNFNNQEHPERVQETKDLDKLEKEVKEKETKTKKSKDNKKDNKDVKKTSKPKTNTSKKTNEDKKQ